MTNFLRVDFLRERFREIVEAADYLDRLLEMKGPERRKLVRAYARKGFKTSVKLELKRTVRAIKLYAQGSAEMMDQLPSQPVIYTGAGDTSEVIEMLEALVTEAREAAAGNGGSAPSLESHRRSKGDCR
ncbi:MAG TPA: hypothetical protein VGL40_02360 [Bacillota bacterium]|jgi:hypothetical protein